MICVCCVIIRLSYTRRDVSAMLKTLLAVVASVSVGCVCENFKIKHPSEHSSLAFTYDDAFARGLGVGEIMKISTLT